MGGVAEAGPARPVACGVGVGGGVFGGRGRFPAQSAVVQRGSGAGWPRCQVQRAHGRAWQGPVPGSPVRALRPDGDADGGFVEDSGVDSLEPLVEPAQEVLVEALIVEDDDGGVAVADRPAVDEQLLGAAYLFVAVEVPAQVQAGLVPVRIE